jgi:hypothetical protein
MGLRETNWNLQYGIEDYIALLPTPAKKKYAKAYADWVAGGKKGDRPKPEASGMPAYSGDASKIEFYIDKLWRTHEPGPAVHLGDKLALHRGGEGIGAWYLGSDGHVWYVNHSTGKQSNDGKVDDWVRHQFAAGHAHIAGKLTPEGEKLVRAHGQDPKDIHPQESYVETARRLIERVAQGQEPRAVVEATPFTPDLKRVHRESGLLASAAHMLDGAVGRGPQSGERWPQDLCPDLASVVQAVRNICQELGIGYGDIESKLEQVKTSLIHFGSSKR